MLAAVTPNCCLEMRGPVKELFDARLSVSPPSSLTKSSGSTGTVPGNIPNVTRDDTSSLRGGVFDLFRRAAAAVAEEEIFPSGELADLARGCNKLSPSILLSLGAVSEIGRGGGGLGGELMEYFADIF
jgi:hypothetical protein